MSHSKQQPVESMQMIKCQTQRTLLIIWSLAEPYLGHLFAVPRDKTQIWCWNWGPTLFRSRSAAAGAGGEMSAGVLVDLRGSTGIYGLKPGGRRSCRARMRDAGTASRAYAQQNTQRARATVWRYCPRDFKPPKSQRSGNEQLSGNKSRN